MNHQPRIQFVPRSRDEELLAQVRARANGQSASSIAKRAGVNSGIVITSTNQIMQADIRESGEPEGRVRAAYWGEGK